MTYEMRARPMSECEADQEMRKRFQHLAEHSEDERQSRLAAERESRAQPAKESDEATCIVRLPTMEEAKASVARIRAHGQRQAGQKPSLFGPPSITLTSGDDQPAPAKSATDQNIAPGTSSLPVDSTAGASLTTASVADVARPAVPCLDDCFPVSDASSIVAHADPVDALTKLCSGIITPSDYRSARLRYVELSIQLNLAGRLAPAFRPQPKVNAKLGTPSFMLMHRDALVIDYHWCRFTMIDLSPRESMHARLMGSGSDFSFEEAWLLTGKKLKGAYRGDEAMGLSTLQQCQVRCLQGPEVRMRVQGLSSSYRSSGGQFSGRKTNALREICDWTERQPRMKSERLVYGKLWEARELLGPKNGRLISQLLALMLGTDARDPKTIRDKLANLDRQLGT